MKKICILLLVWVLSVTMIFGADFDLVLKGAWSTNVDSTGSVEPKSGEGVELVKEVDGEKQIHVEWTLEPDKENGGSIWTWGELLGSFTPDGKAQNLKQVVEMEITYSSTSDLYVKIILGKGKVKEDGAQHRYRISSTNGEFITRKIKLKRFSQPSWTQVTKRLNLASVESISIQPILPQGGKGVFIVKSLKFIGMDEKSVK